MSWVRDIDGAAVLTIKVVPRASRSEVAGTLGDALRVRLQAPPVEGKANRALVVFLAKALQVHAREVTLVAGDLSRHKRVAVAGVTAAQVRARLAPQDTGR